MTVKEIIDKNELETVFPIIKELRTHLSFSDFIFLYEQAKQSDDYKVVGIYQQASCVGVMGYRVLFDLVHGKHLYVDDLVTTQSVRPRGVGKKLLQFAEEEAKKLGCKGLRLCTGTENEAGKRFYEREGWKFRSVAYKKQL
jgi:GNAT superfamily N-acetyltransferase